jgi:protein-disulfide isomerase
MRLALFLLPLLLLAGCGDGTADSNVAAPAAAPVNATAAPTGQVWTDVVEKTPEGGFRMGNPDAPIKLVEYGSRTCHVCQAFAETGMEPLKAQFIATGKVSYEYRDYLRNGADLAASLLGQCGGTGPFFPILDQMFAVQADTLAKAPGQNDPFYKRLEAATPAQQPAIWAEGFGYLDFVKQRGIPEAKARACLADAAASAALVKANEVGTTEYSIQGTPTFILGGKVLPNTVTWEQVQAALKAAGA